LKDHILISCITGEGEILNMLRRNLPNVRAVQVPHATCGGSMAFVDPRTFTVTKMGIYAMRPVGRDFAERLVITDNQRARARSILSAAGVSI
jgi:2,5-furandicarboxylate decarboxylase 1